ncbi:MAG TPA: hypothetical protein VFF16_16280, partial [Telluria sp.]|nr:hypothetical protein [Telluria sp.]
MDELVRFKDEFVPIVHEGRRYCTGPGAPPVFPDKEQSMTRINLDPTRVPAASTALLEQIHGAFGA